MRHVKYSGRVMYSLSVGKMELTDSVMSSTMIWYCFLQLGRTTKLYCLRWFIIFHYMLFEMSLPNSTTILVLLRHNQVLLLPFLECKKKHCLYLSRMLSVLMSSYVLTCFPNLVCIHLIVWTWWKNIIELGMQSAFIKHLEKHKFCYICFRCLGL